MFFPQEPRLRGGGRTRTSPQLAAVTSCSRGVLAYGHPAAAPAGVPAVPASCGC